MQGDTVQPTRISKEEYKRFKQWVQDTHGTTRGHLSTEIENALREYRQPDNKQDKLTRIEDDIASVKAMLAEVEADGGTAPLPSEDTRTHTRADTTKPRPNSPRSSKVEWIISEYYSPGGGSTTPQAIQSQVQGAFGFGERTAEEYVQLVVDELGAKRHPENNDLLVWGENLKRVKNDE
jgi:hypothetical protein